MLIKAFDKKMATIKQFDILKQFLVYSTMVEIGCACFLFMVNASENRGILLKADLDQG